MRTWYPSSYSPAVHHNPAATGATTDAGDATVSRRRSAQSFRTQNQADQARYPVIQWLCAGGYLGAEAKTTGAEIEAWRQGTAAAAAARAEARRHLLTLANGADPVAVALGRPVATAEDLTAARQAVAAAEDTALAFRVSPVAVEAQRAWLALWNSPDSTWLAALDRVENVKGPEADQARRWLTYHLTLKADDARLGLARSGGNWIVAGQAR